MNILGPWKTYPTSKGTLALSVFYPIPLSSELIPAPSKVVEDLKLWIDFLSSTHLSFELIVEPYGKKGASLFPRFADINELTRSHPELRLKSEASSSTRAEAIRKGFFESHGEVLVFVDPEQPCELDFFNGAFELFRAGCDFVRANRRLPKSRFFTPVRLLPYIYRRHEMSQIHNVLVRSLFPIRTTDVQSTNYVMKRKVAFEVFKLQSQIDMGFEIEVALVVHALGARTFDLPVRIPIKEEKSTQRFLSELILSLKNLGKIFIRYKKGCYNRFKLNQASSADDWGLSPGVNAGILQLAQAGVISRVSLMATERYLELGLDELKKVRGIELGIHFNLTHGTTQSLGHESPMRFLFKWMTQRKKLLPLARNEFLAQMKRLQEAGVRPTYLDGHHHMHLAPGLIQEISDLLKTNGITDVRLPLDFSISFGSKFILTFLSLWAIPTFKRLGLKTRPFFYPQKNDFLDPGLLRAKLNKHPANEVIVHPAETDDVRLLKQPDSYSADRVLEYQALQMLVP